MYIIYKHEPYKKGKYILNTSEFFTKVETEAIAQDFCYERNHWRKWEWDAWYSYKRMG